MCYLNRNSNFVSWFDGSQVINQHGEPLIVYHGTNKAFNEFKLSFGGRNTNDNGKLGFYFTESSTLAQAFCRKKWDNENSRLKVGGNILPVYLSIKNPKVITAKQFVMIPYDINEYRDFQIEQGYDGLIIEPFSAEDAQAWIRMFGDNSACMEFSSNQYCAFYPEQIKSAIANNGSFNKQSKNILN